MPSREQGVPQPADAYDVYIVRMQRVWRPPTDVYETDDHLVVKVEIAGVEEDDFAISLVERRLVIAGRRRDAAGKLSYRNMEIHYGEFRTEVQVDWSLDSAAIEASYVAGFLFVRLPKAKEHRVTIKVDLPGEGEQ